MVWLLFHSSQELEEAAGDVSAAATTGEGGEDEPDDEGQPSLEEALAQLGLTSLTEKFQNEQIDFDSLVSLTCYTTIHMYFSKSSNNYAQASSDF